ncbi:MAG: putative Ig domain-containing protein, partial [Verrucomicrobiota bacterium]
EGGASKKVVWLIIPAPASGGTNPRGELYYIGANIQYKVNGVIETVDLDPDFIHVKPMPDLELEYFLPGPVNGDDPATPSIIEPLEPFSLGVRIKNSGSGIAKSLSIESSQPRIVENEHGLLIAFRIFNNEVNGQPAAPTLLANFGDIQPGRVAIGRWGMTASLTGEFTEFAASFKHADELGGAVTSLLKTVSTYRLIQNVLVDLPGRDQVRDFLAETMQGAGTKVYESDALNPLSVLKFFSGTMPAAEGNNYYRLSVALPPDSVELLYARQLDPKAGTFDLKRVERSDGKVLSQNNVWLSKEKQTEDGPWIYYVNLFDAANSGNYSYLLEYGPKITGNRKPNLGMIGDRTLLAGNAYTYRILATDPDQDAVTLSASSLPSGATFTDQGQGVGFFSWTPGINQIGKYSVQFKASDGSLVDTRSMNLVVTTRTLLDAWKDRYWPGITDPLIIGNSADPDKDGLSNLVEYAMALDPTQPSANPTEVGVTEIGQHQYVTLTYVRRTDDTRLQFTVKGNSTSKPGAGWVAQSNVLPADQQDVLEGFIRERIVDSVPLDDASSAPRRFLRLDITLNL